MIHDSLQIRRTAIAYLYQGAPAPDRVTNLAFYDEITKSVDLPEMIQQPQELVLLNRSTGNPGYAMEVRVGAMAPAVAPPPGTATPSLFRFLVVEMGASKPLKFFTDAADTMYQAFQRGWGGRIGRVQLVFSPTSPVRAQSQVGTFETQTVSCGMCGA